ncbi:MAG: hypothetical protein R2748_35430 [Bryobacterales bacterium]
MTVRRPVRRGDEPECFFRHLTLVGPVCIHDPKIVAAAAIGGEGDLFPVRRKTRLHVEGEAFRDTPRRAARDRHRIDVAEKVECDHPPVRADIDIHPRALVDVDLDLAHVSARRRRDVPFLFVFGVVREYGRCESRQCGAGEQDALHGIPLLFCRDIRRPEPAGNARGSFC